MLCGSSKTGNSNARVLENMLFTMLDTKLEIWEELCGN